MTERKCFLGNRPTALMFVYRTVNIKVICIVCSTVYNLPLTTLQGDRKAGVPERMGKPLLHFCKS